MTLIITQISKHGIIHASDSNLTDENGKTVGVGKKCFAIPNLNAGLTVAGAFSVGSIRMDDWMNNFIDSSSAITLEELSNELAQKLEAEMTEDEKSSGSLIHICGYSQKNGKCFPEFWFVRNIYHMNLETGEYYGIENQFQVSEDFWNRDNIPKNLFSYWQHYDDVYQLYINGFTPGRISYNIIKNQLRDFFAELWNRKNWKFRPPKNIEESKLLVQNFMSLVNTVFILSDYEGQFIGGELQFYLVEQPANILV